jgi:hypothetical protein
MNTLPTAPQASRRALLMGFAAAATPMAPALANALGEPAPAAGADAELLDLCRRTIEQSERWAEADLIQDRLHGELGYKGPFRRELEDRATDATEQAGLEFDRLDELYVAVINTSALTTEGITTDANIALSLVRDLINRGQARP